MRVVASRVDVHEGALHRGVGNAHGVHGRRAGALLTLVDEDGVIGQGEASPLPGYSPDTLARCLEALVEVHTRLGASRGLAPLEAVGVGLAPIGASLDATPAARFALETALLDLVGRRAGRSVASCLAAGTPRERVDRSGLVDASLPPGDRVGAAVAVAERGLRAVKIKVGDPRLSAQAERDLLAAMRAALPTEMEIRLDANGAWSIDEARARLEGLAGIAPAWIEEPTSGFGLFALGRCATPWAADESLALPGFGERLFARPRGCAAVVLKPALLGGLLPSLALARRASALGLAVVVTHLFDGPVALAAACELALALPDRVQVAACGLDPHPGLSVWPEAVIPQLAVESAIVSSSHDGLGLEPLRAGGGR